MKAEEPIQGEYKIFEVDYDFTYNGEELKKGELRRLHLSDAREREHRYQDSGPRLQGQPPARITILEPRPRPSMTPEERAERELAVAKGLAKERGDGWVSSCLKRI